MLTMSGRTVIESISNHLQGMSEKSKAYLMGYIECLVTERRSDLMSHHAEAREKTSIESSEKKGAKHEDKKHDGL